MERELGKQTHGEVFWARTVLSKASKKRICIGGEQGGYFCDKNGVSPGHLPDLKGVWCNRGKKELSWVEWFQIAASQPASQAGESLLVWEAGANYSGFHKYNHVHLVQPATQL